MRTTTRALICMVVLLVGCSSPKVTDDRTNGVSGSLTISAAASLSDVLEDLLEDFTTDHPALEVRTNYGSSSQLAAQVTAGAPADVVAFADERTMADLAGAGLLEGPARIFASNDMVAATEPANPLRIESLEDLEDLGDPEVVALCAKDAPCGRYASALLDANGVSLDESMVTRAQNATATLTALTSGDARAAVIYRSDAVRAGGRLTVIEPPPGTSPVAHYPVAVLGGTTNPVAAEAFVDHLFTEPSRETLASAGFGPP